MAQLVRITETAEAITAEASAYVWEEYDAPRKRVKRARIVEHDFTISIPKVSEDAAPLAFVVEHFPQMVGRKRDEYRPGYDQPIRCAFGKLYTPARFVGHPRYSGSYTNAAEELNRAIKDESMPDYVVRDYADMIARDAVRADEWHSYSHITAESIERDAAHHVERFIVICGELWTECSEPVYEYHSPYRGYGWNNPAYINVTTDSDNRTRGICGALDRFAMALYWNDVNRIAYIDVKRPDLVTFDVTAHDLASSRDRASKELDEARESVKKLEEQLEEARAALSEAAVNLDTAREKCEQYAADPRAYWMDKAGLYDGSKFSSHRKRAAAFRQIVAEEA